MERIIAKNKYPAWKEEIKKSEINKSLKEVVEHFVEKIEQDSAAKLIGIFDHFQHTKQLNGPIAEGIKGANIVVFCFGKKITGPVDLATKPRSIGIVETDDKFVITFLEAPSDATNEKLKKWVNELIG